MEIRPLSRDQFLSLIRRSGLSQEQIAGYLGVTHPAVQQWLSGKTRPSARVLLVAALLWRERTAKAQALKLGPDGRLP